MSEFNLDTSGVVREYDNAGGLMGELRWSDLSPFEQGYVEAMFAEFLAGFSQYEKITQLAGFSDLAPETLSAIQKDCAGAPSDYAFPKGAEGGARFWDVRQLGDYPEYPPLTPYLGDDGRVYLRETPMGATSNALPVGRG